MTMHMSTCGARKLFYRELTHRQPSLRTLSVGGEGSTTLVSVTWTGMRASPPIGVGNFRVGRTTSQRSGRTGGRRDQHGQLDVLEQRPRDRRIGTQGGSCPAQAAELVRSIARLTSDCPSLPLPNDTIADKSRRRDTEVSASVSRASATANRIASPAPWRWRDGFATSVRQDAIASSRDCARTYMECAMYSSRDS